MYARSWPNMKDTSRYCIGTLASARPIAPRLSLSRYENDVVRWPDSIFFRRFMSTNYSRA